MNEIIDKLYRASRSIPGWMLSLVQSNVAGESIMLTRDEVEDAYLEMQERKKGGCRCCCCPHKELHQ